jgi:energy-converting hydrogenase Eha subunit E
MIRTILKQPLVEVLTVNVPFVLIIIGVEIFNAFKFINSLMTLFRVNSVQTCKIILCKKSFLTGYVSRARVSTNLNELLK